MLETTLGEAHRVRGNHWLGNLACESAQTLHIELIAWEHRRRNSMDISVVGTADLSWAISRTILTASNFFFISSEYGNVQACSSMYEPRDVTKNLCVARTTATWPCSRSKHLPKKMS